MTDPRWEQLADVLVNYSTRTRAGDKVLITMMEVETLPLVCAVYSQAVRVGAFPQVQFASAYLERELLLHGSDELIRRVPDLEIQGMEWADVYIGLRGARNPYELEGVPAERVKWHKAAMGTVSGLRTERTRWVLARVPNESLAQQAEMSLDEMTGFFFQATLKDWSAETRRYEALQQIFEAAGTVRIVGRNTDLSFSTAGRHYEIGDGRYNMPDGEIYTAPVDDSAEGHICFEFPGIYSGRKIEGIRLEFRNGRVWQATAASNQPLLHEILQTDEGAQRLGEFGVGTNSGITRYFNDILYDEKIGGTVHLALGRAYPECGGVNRSAVHWDIVKDLRTEGAIYLDNRKVFEDGSWLVEWSPGS